MNDEDRYYEALEWLQGRMTDEETGMGWGIADAVAGSYAHSIDTLLHTNLTWDECLSIDDPDDEDDFCNDSCKCFSCLAWESCGNCDYCCPQETCDEYVIQL
jgi:hypothetical protein